MRQPAGQALRRHLPAGFAVFPEGPLRQVWARADPDRVPISTAAGDPVRAPMPRRVPTPALAAGTGARSRQASVPVPGRTSAQNGTGAPVPATRMPGRAPAPGRDLTGRRAGAGRPR